MACGGDVRISAGGIVVGGMMRLVAWCVHFPNRLIISAQCEAIPISSVHLETRRYPVDHGWMCGTVNNILTRVMFPTSVPPTPDYILRMIKCSYENCGSARCSCLSTALLF